MPSSTPLATQTAALLFRLGIDPARIASGSMASFSPVTGEKLARLTPHTVETAAAAIDRAGESFLEWRLVPAPKRGELVRLLSEELRAAKADLGRLVSIEVGKSISEGAGEVYAS